MKTNHKSGISRRRFLHTTAGFSAVSLISSRQVFGSEANSMIQMGIVGTGGRGQFDGRNLIKTGKVKITALADYFDFQMEGPARDFGVEKARCFAGIDGYKSLMELKDVDAVLLTTAPYFRPMQFEAAIEAGKHVFAEKPVAVDPWGCRLFLEIGEKAKKKNLTVGAGLQSRYDEGRQKIAQMIHDGKIGELLVGHSTRMGSDLWRRERPASFSERDYQVRHWLYYQWGCGDFINEMHIHNLDVFNWFTGMLPLSATGRGGRRVRLDVGDIYDYIQVLYEYPNGFTLTHTGSQINAGYQGSEKQILGTKGYYDEKTGLFADGKNIAEHGGIRDATEEEMKQFVASVLGERPTINNCEYAVTSTFTCILGREAAYAGEKTTWKSLWKSKRRLALPEMGKM